MLENAHRIQALVLARVAPLLERWLPTALTGRVQRMSAYALKQVLARWPIIGELLVVRAPASRTRKEAEIASFIETPTASPPAAAGDETPEQLMHQLASGADWETRARAAAALAYMDAPAIIDALVCALRDPSTEVAAAAIEALAVKGNARVVDVLQNVVNNSDGFFDTVTRATAVAGLARRAQMTHVFAAVHDVDMAVSIAAISAIAEHAPDAASAYLLPIVRDRSGYFLPLTRVAAISALERSAALPNELALDLLASEPDASVRAALQRRA